MSDNLKTKIAVIKGGFSLEREVSLVTGKECAKALRDEGYNIFEIDAGQTLVSELTALEPDVVFNALHGRWGEDGSVQGILEWLKIPYTHSGILASSLAMNKIHTKFILDHFHLPTAKSKKVLRDDLKIGIDWSSPFVIKPSCEGSSLGVEIIMNSDRTINLEALPEGDLMIEEYIPGRELSASVLDDQALSLGEIITDDWYDYKAKYTKGVTTIEVPARIPSDVANRCLEYALKAHQVLGCKGLTRTDFRWDDRKGVDGLIILEVNTQPGMTPVSLAPKHALEKNITFGKLCRILVEGASCNR